MTKYLILITILVLLYLYWKAQQTKSLPHNPDEIIERKGKQKEIFWDAEDFDLSSDDSDDENQTVVNESKNENQTINGPKSVELPSAKFIPVRGQSANTKIRGGFKKKK